ncbi:MAG: EAL domain-containing protein [Peptococcaceae bacterium]
MNYDGANGEKLINIRIFIGCALVVLALQLLFSHTIANQFEAEMKSQREADLNKMVQVAHNAINPIIKDVRDGNISREAGLAKVKDMVRQMVYEDEFGSNYIFMSSYDGTMLVQPFEPGKEGTNQWDLQDVYGKYLIRELINAARQSPEGSFVSYFYYPPNEDTAEEKLSYVVGIPELNAYIGTGMYIESGYKALEKLINRQRAGFILITVIIFFLTTMLISELTKRNALLQKEVHDRIYTERLLSESEQKYKALYESASDAIFLLKDGIFVECNPKAEELLGCRKTEIIGKTLLDFSPELQPGGVNSQEKFLAVNARAIEGGTQFFEWQYYTYQGAVFYAEVSLNNIELNDMKYIQSIVRDVSQRVKDKEKIQWQYKALKKTQTELVEKHEELTAIYEELTASEEELRNNYEELSNLQNETKALADRYMLVTEAANDIIWDYDGISEEMYVSERVWELLGYKQEEFAAKMTSFFPLIHPEDKPRVTTEYFAHLKGATPYFSSEHRLKTKDGDYKWIYARGKAAKNKDGKIIRNAGSLTDITDKKLYEKEIRKLAFYDYLTGLPNRIHLINRLKRAMELCLKNGCSGAVFYLDLDNFKMINDSFGHNYGDLLLVEISKRILRKIEKSSLARIGGDEFVVLLEHVESKQEIENTALKIQKLFNEPFKVDANLFFITCSMGIAVYPNDGTTVDEVLKSADMAMYEAKVAGRNKYVYYDSQMGEKLVNKLEMVNRLREAVTNQELFLLYQPQIDVTTGSIVGFEALLRWENPDYGIVSPNVFIPLAEETGMIIDIGNWVISNVFAFAAELNGLGYNAPPISINVSPVQFMENIFVDRVTEISEKHLLDPGKIGLEITENIFVDAFDIFVGKLHALKARGFQIHLDDFGRGYSSLNFLKNLPIDTVKIDKSFIDGIVGERKEQKILNSIIYLAKNIGLTVIAEGVETEEQVKYLLSSYCYIIQGYYFSKPVPKNEVIMLLKNGKNFT